MTSVRTAVLAQGDFTGTALVILATVPAGETWIVKSVYVINTAAVAQSVFLSARRPSVPISVWFFTKSLNANELATWEGWVVLAPGDQLCLTMTVAPARLWASGSRLIGAA